MMPGTGGEDDLPDTGGEIDQSCNISTDCLDNCKLCDATIYYKHFTGNYYGFNQSAEGVQCLCKKGKCKKFGKKSNLYNMIKCWKC